MIFLNSVRSAAALVFYLPVVCTNSDTMNRIDQSPIYSKILGKNTIFNEHPVPVNSQTIPSIHMAMRDNAAGVTGRIWNVNFRVIEISVDKIYVDALLLRI